MKQTNSNKLLTTLAVVVILITPLAIAKFMDISAFRWMKNDNDWIGFWGGYLGGICTLGGVLLTIKQTKREMRDNQRLSIMPYLTVREDLIMDESMPFVSLSQMVIPETNISEEGYELFFRCLTIKGIFRSVGMGHAVNCRIESLFIEKKPIKYSTGTKSMLLQDQEAPFIVKLFDFGLMKDEISSEFLENYIHYFRGDMYFSGPPELKVNFKVCFEDVVGNKYMQNVLYTLQIFSSETKEFNDEDCDFSSMSRPALL